MRVDGVATGASVAPYNPAQRDTALLRYLHAISFLHGMSAAAATPAHPRTATAPGGAPRARGGFPRLDLASAVLHSAPGG